MKADTVRVLQVVDTLGMGGAETWLMEVLRRWSRDGTGQMDFLITSGNRGVFDDEAIQLGARPHYARYGRRHMFGFARTIRRILREGRYDAIHDHQDFASGWHYLLSGSELPPVRVTHVHNAAYQIRTYYGVTAARRATARLGARLVARYATHIAGTSRGVISDYGFDAPRFGHIRRAALHCAFDPGRFLGDRSAARAAICREMGWPADARIVLVAGRMDRSPFLDHSLNQKNTGFSVAVGIESVHRDRRVRLLFVGAMSDARAALEQRIGEADCAGHIVFAGVRRDIEALMLASDVLLFPSRGEGLGIVAVEAQAAGLPVLASTAVPGECVVVPELVRFQDIDDGTSAWASSILDLSARDRNVRHPNELVAASAFAIDNSSRALLRLYGEGSLG